VEISINARQSSVLYQTHLSTECIPSSENNVYVQYTTGGIEWTY